MSPELIAILTIGVSLGGGQLATALWVAGRFERVGKEMADLRERVGTELAELRERIARLEGLLDGLREAISGRRETA